MDSNRTVSLRKRQQIGSANKTMFISVAGASVIVGFCVVVSLFMFQKISFGEKVLSEKSNTESTLKHNLGIVGELKAQVNKLSISPELKSVRLSEDDSPLQSILDALPADANSAAMASSLQLKLLRNVPDINIDSLRVESLDGGTDDTFDTAAGISGDADFGAIGFSFVISTSGSNGEGLKQVLLNIEKSIRPFNITSIQIESQGSRLVMTVLGESYYLQPKTMELSSKVVKQNEKQ